MSDLSGVWIVAGAAVGGLAALGPAIVTAVSQGRARKAEAAASAAAAAEAKRRPVYERLIVAINAARTLYAQLLHTVEANDGKLSQFHGDQFSEAADDAADKLYAAATEVRIDGSDRARELADDVTSTMMIYLADLSAEERIEPGNLRALCANLKQAEDDVVDAARADFGAKSG